MDVLLIKMSLVYYQKVKVRMDKHIFLAAKTRRRICVLYVKQYKNSVILNISFYFSNYLQTIDTINFPKFLDKAHQIQNFYVLVPIWFLQYLNLNYNRVFMFQCRFIIFYHKSSCFPFR
jgi:hypothetical protein